MSKVRTLRVTFSSGRVEDIPNVAWTNIADRNSVIMNVYGPEVYGEAELLKTIVLANVDTYQWVE